MKVWCWHPASPTGIASQHSHQTRVATGWILGNTPHFTIVPTETAFRAHQGLAGLQQLTREWIDLVATIPDVSFNHIPSYYHAYLESGDCDPSSVWFIAAHRGERLVAVCPLQFQRHRVPLQPRYLGTLDGNELQLSDFIFAPSADNSSLVMDLTRWLRAQRVLRWDVLRLVKVAENSSLGFSANAQRPSLTLVANYDASAYFDTRGSYDRATHAMANKMRSNLRRRTRLAEQAAPLRFESCRRPSDVARGFEVFLQARILGVEGCRGQQVIDTVPAQRSCVLRDNGTRVHRSQRVRHQLALAWRGAHRRSNGATLGPNSVYSEGRVPGHHSGSRSGNPASRPNYSLRL